MPNIPLVSWSGREGSLGMRQILINLNLILLTYLCTCFYVTTGGEDLWRQWPGKWHGYKISCSILNMIYYQAITTPVLKHRFLYRSSTNLHLPPPLLSISESTTILRVFETNACKPFKVQNNWLERSFLTNKPICTRTCVKHRKRATLKLQTMPLFCLTFVSCGVYILRLVFTSDGVEIRSIERYDLVKIKPTESETEHWFCLWLIRKFSQTPSGAEL